MTLRKIVWFARGGGILRAGPFRSQTAAAAALRQVAESDEEYARATCNGVRRARLSGGFPADAFTWPEEL